MSGARGLDVRRSSDTHWARPHQTLPPSLASPRRPRLQPARGHRKRPYQRAVSATIRRSVLDAKRQSVTVKASGGMLAQHQPRKVVVAKRGLRIFRQEGARLLSYKISAYCRAPDSDVARCLGAGIREQAGRPCSGSSSKRVTRRLASAVCVAILSNEETIGRTRVV